MFIMCIRVRLFGKIVYHVDGKTVYQILYNYTVSQHRNLLVYLKLVPTHLRDQFVKFPAKLLIKGGIENLKKHNSTVHLSITLSKCREYFRYTQKLVPTHTCVCNQFVKLLIISYLIHRKKCIIGKNRRYSFYLSILKIKLEDFFQY